MYIRFPRVGKPIYYRHPLVTIPRISEELESDAHEAFGWFAVAVERLFWDGMEYPAGLEPIQNVDTKWVM